jgi:type II pantothenate kinase
MIIGIDIGSTTTKVVAAKDGEVLKAIKTKAFDAVTSATGALGKMLIENDFNIKDIEKIIITGVGASKINSDIFGIKTEKIDEMSAVGKGGLFLSKSDNIVITNIGTGTSIIEARNGVITHIGGTGIGGGTIIGLSKILLNTTDFDNILEQAAHGDLKQVDLLIEDILDTEISFLNRETTASNFGKMLDTAKKEDVATGIVNMVFQVIGMLSVFAAKSRNLNHILVTGNGSRNLLGRKILEDISRMYNIEFAFPADGEYTTAIGAALSGQ